MGDTKMNEDGDLVDYNEVDSEDLNAKRSPKLDWTFNDEHEKLSKSGDSSSFSSVNSLSSVDLVLSKLLL